MEAIVGGWVYHGRGQTNFRWALAMAGNIRAGTCTPQRSKPVSNIAALSTDEVHEMEPATGRGECRRAGRLKNMRRRRVCNQPQQLPTHRESKPKHRHMPPAAEEGAPKIPGTCILGVGSPGAEAHRPTTSLENPTQNPRTWPEHRDP